MAAVQMIDVPHEQGALPRGWLTNNRIAPSQARPKQTLFGTTLQCKDNALLHGIRSINMNADKGEMKHSQNPKARSLATEAVHQQGKDVHFQKKVHIAEKPEPICDTENLSSLEEKSRYFKVQCTANPGNPPQERSKVSQKLTEQDIEHAAEMNVVGLKNGSFNHHKYGKKPPVHQYCLIGDMLAKGMDFTENTEKPNHIIPKMQPFKRHRDPYAVPKEAYMRSKADEKILEGAGMALPANIRHQFGTEVCEMLLADPEQVKRTIAEQKHSYLEARRPHKPLQKAIMPEEGLDPSYNAIGTSTRANIFGPSITVNHKIGTMKQNFNDDVHRNRVAETDAFRYQRDELSQWWQHETLRGLMKRKWDEYEQSKPKFMANWDRNAKRRPPPPKPKEPKAKPQPKPVPKPVPKALTSLNDIVFEDIEFMTPPLTPQGIKPIPPAPAPKLSADDDDFWDFYNQGIPLP